MPAIIINGNNLTMVDMMGGGRTAKFEYNSNTGVITITAGGEGVSNMEFKDGSIWLSGVEYKKVD
jgi:hypothetical protein